MKADKLYDGCVASLCALMFAILPAIAQADDDFERIFIFGDSLSDAGNVFELTGNVSTAPYLVVPAAPYDIGGHRFSNGKTWAERFAADMQNNTGGKASLKKPGKNGNYAFGGARARSGTGGSPDASTQIAMYLGDHGVADADALYVVQFGGNDLRDALVAAASDPGAAIVIIQTAIGDLALNIQTLYAAGARNFLVANVPNLAHAPAIKLAGVSGVAGFFTGIYNGGLEGTLQQLEMFLPGIEIRRLDIAGFTDAVVANPGAFGLSVTEVPCLSFFTEVGAICDEPGEYLFWDGLHPTAAAHKELAEYAAEQFDVDGDSDED